jgi:dTDP-4-amino-4,6-dideoxygalactose transaminase
VTNKRIYLSPPHLGNQEMGFIKDAFEKNWITTSGENVDAFEKGICKVTEATHCAALNSGTAAIHLALILAGVSKNDEVICSTFTFVASANPIVYLGAIPLFVDSESDSWNMSPELLELTIKDRIKKGKKPKAILLVHLYGRPAKLKEILAIANQYEILLIEDAAESLGSTFEGKMTGTFGQMGIYSFNGNKIITTSGGGALVSNDEKIIAKARFLSAQARDIAPYYQHSEIGFNYRMSNILAGIGLGQLQVLEKRIEYKRWIFNYYKDKLEISGKFSFPKEQKGTFCNTWLTTIISNDEAPESIRLRLEARNIESRLLWKPLHLQPVFKDAPSYVNGTSEYFFNKGLCLPSGTSMTERELNEIIDVLSSN